MDKDVGLDLNEGKPYFIVVSLSSRGTLFVSLSIFNAHSFALILYFFSKK